jgi:hypothetical protein
MDSKQKIPNSNSILNSSNDAKDLVNAKLLTSSEHGGRYMQLVQYWRESTHKSRAQGAPSSLGVYMYTNQHINKEENETISGA